MLLIILLLVKEVPVQCMSEDHINILLVAYGPLLTKRKRKKKQNHACHSNVRSGHIKMTCNDDHFLILLSWIEHCSMLYFDSLICEKEKLVIYSSGIIC